MCISVIVTFIVGFGALSKAYASSPYKLPKARPVFQAGVINEYGCDDVSQSIDEPQVVPVEQVVPPDLLSGICNPDPCQYTISDPIVISDEEQDESDEVALPKARNVPRTSDVSVHAGEDDRVDLDKSNTREPMAEMEQVVLSRLTKTPLLSNIHTDDINRINDNIHEISNDQLSVSMEFPKQRGVSQKRTSAMTRTEMRTNAYPIVTVLSSDEEEEQMTNKAALSSDSPAKLFDTRHLTVTEMPTRRYKVWKFIIDKLLSRNNEGFVRWLNQNKLRFKIVDVKQFTREWEKFSNAGETTNFANLHKNLLKYIEDGVFHNRYRESRYRHLLIFQMVKTRTIKDYITRARQHALGSRKTKIPTKGNAEDVNTMEEDERSPDKYRRATRLINAATCRDMTETKESSEESEESVPPTEPSREFCPFTLEEVEKVVNDVNAEKTFSTSPES